MTGGSAWQVGSLSLENFRSMDHLSIEFGPAVTLLVGKNGSGKSAVLDALAVMLSPLVVELGGDGRAFSHADVRTVSSDLDSRGRQATSEPQYPLTATLSANLGGHAFMWERKIAAPKGRTTAGDARVRQFMKLIREASFPLPDAVAPHTVRSDALPVFAYYGVERTSGSRRGDGQIPPSRTGAYLAALDPRPDLTRLGRFLETLDGQILAAQAYGDTEPSAAIRQFKAVELACDQMLAPAGWSRLRWNRGVDALTLSHPVQGTLPLSSLASGVKIAAGLALDLASRMARANPHLGHYQLLAETPGIVMIDEIDLHLHPTWQKVIVPLFRRTFPKVQLIATTHSPQVIATVESGDVRVLEEGTVGIPQHGYGLRPDKVLQVVQQTNPVPDTPAGETLQRYLDLVRAGVGREPEALELRKRIEEVLGGISLVPELIDADALMEYEDLVD